MPSSYPVAALLGALLFVARHDKLPREHQAALLMALRAVLGKGGFRVRAEAEALQVNDEAIALDAPGAAMLNQQLLLHGIQCLELPAEFSDEEVIRAAGVLASYPGTYNSHRAVMEALGPTAQRVSLTPVSGGLGIFTPGPWRPYSVSDPDATDRPARLEIPGALRGNTAEFEQYQATDLDPAAAEGPESSDVPTGGSSASVRPPLDQSLRQGHEAIVQEDWAGLLEAALQIVEAEHEAASELMGSTHRIELKRLLPSKYLTQIARLTGGEHKQEAITLLQRFGADATEILMDLLIGGATIGERRGYYSALIQMNEGMDTIVRHLGHHQWYVIRNAAELCGEMSIAEAVPELSERCEHPDERVRKAVAEALGKICTLSAIAPLKRLLADPSPIVRKTALAYLTGRPARAMTSPIAELLAREENPEVQQEALLALGRIGSSDAVGVLKNWVTATSKLGGRKPVGLRLIVVQALATIGPAAVDTLDALQQDEASEVRAAALSALQSIRP
jgi:HEAT repeat protein